MSYKKFFFIPTNSYTMIDVNEIKEILLQKYPIEHIVINKIFPKTLKIDLQEKISNVIYDNGSEYSYLDTEGNIVEIIRKVGDNEWQRNIKITTSTNDKGEIIEKEEVISESHHPDIDIIIKEMGDYPIIYDTRKQIIEINSNVLSPEIVKGSIQWFNLINKNFHTPFAYVEIHNGIGDGVIKMREGWYLMVDLEKNIKEQFEQLKFLLEEKIDKKKLNYIDLRFLGKVYWQ